VRWPLVITIALVLHVVVSLGTVYVATSNPSYAVEEDYYQKALRWDEKRAQDRRNAELGWRLVLEVEPPARRGDPAVLTAHLSDADGTPLDAAGMAVEAFHNARSGNIVRTALAGRGEGHYGGEFPMRRPGLWEFRVVVERDGERFTQTDRRYLQ
jgi:nitrogen fixation protein FixH